MFPENGVLFETFPLVYFSYCGSYYASSAVAQSTGAHTIGLHTQFELPDCLQRVYPQISQIPTTTLHVHTTTPVDRPIAAASLLQFRRSFQAVLSLSSTLNAQTHTPAQPENKAQRSPQISRHSPVLKTGTNFITRLCVAATRKTYIARFHDNISDWHFIFQNKTPQRSRPP